MRKLLFVLAALCGLAAPASAQDRLACQRPGIVTKCPGNVDLAPGAKLAVAAIPTAIPATSIAGGTVSNVVFAYLANVTDDIQTQINLKLAANGDASSLTNIPAAQLAGNIARARITTALAAGGDPVVGTVLTATTRTETPTAGPNSTQQHTLPAVASDTVTLNAASQALTNKAISGASNTITNVSLTAGVTGTLPVANGGTGGTSLAAHGVVIGNGTSPVAVTGAGTWGQVMTSNGASADPTFKNPITATRGSSSLGVTYSVTGSYASTGLSVALPAAGTFKVCQEMRQVVSVSASPSGFITTKLRNSTTSTDVANSERLGIVAPTTGVGYTGTVTTCSDVTGAASDVIQLWAIRGSGPTYTTVQIVAGDADGRTILSYENVAP
jgi:hypothetical protein